MKKGIAVFLAFAMVFSGISLSAPEARGESRRVLDCHFTCHEHTEGCYTDGVLTCGQAAGCLHRHTGDCYDANGALICPLQERTHTHSNECYDEGGNLICEYAGMPEHIHGEGCSYNVEIIPEAEPIPEPAEEPAPAETRDTPIPGTEDDLPPIPEEPAPAVTEETVSAESDEPLPAAADDTTPAIPEDAAPATTEETTPILPDGTTPVAAEEATPTVTEEVSPEPTKDEDTAPAGPEEAIHEDSGDKTPETPAENEPIPMVGAISEEDDGNEAPSETGNEVDKTSEIEKTIPAENHRESDRADQSAEAIPANDEEKAGGTGETITNGKEEETDESGMSDETLPADETGEADDNTGETENDVPADDSKKADGTGENHPDSETENAGKAEETDDAGETEAAASELPSALIPVTEAQEDSDTDETEAPEAESGTTEAEDPTGEPSGTSETAGMITVSPKLDGIEGVANPELGDIELSIDTLLDAGAIETLLISASAADTSYNAEEQGLLPAIRNQGQYGTCWAFATIGAIEADLILSDRSLVSAIDFSELHLAWFAMHTFTDVKGNNADSVTSSGLDYLNNGGIADLAYRTLMNLLGLVKESDVPYADAATYTPDPDGRGQNAATPVAAYEISITDEQAVKQAILDHGGVAAAMYANSKDNYYNSAYNSYYYPYSTKPNHAIMLVGWDDDFAASRFNYNPGRNGAWLVRNSWGGTGYCYEAYFWMSYADQGLLNGNSVTAYDAEMGTRYDYVYAYDNDPLLSAGTGGYTRVEIVSTFPVDAGETIESVGFEVYATDAKATVRLDTGNRYITATQNIPTDGFYIVSLPAGLKIRSRSDVKITLIFEGQSDIYFAYENAGSTQYGTIQYNAVSTSGGFDINGYHYTQDPRLRLYTTKTTDPSEVPTSKVNISQSSLELARNETARLTAEALPTWADRRSILWSSDNTRVATIDSDGNITPVGMGSATITAAAADGKSKATCSVTVTPPRAENVSLSPDSLNLYEDESANLTVTVSPADARDKSVTFSSADSSVATVNSSGKVTGVREGTTRITATNKDSGKTSTCTVAVKKFFHVDSISVRPDSLSLEEGDFSTVYALISPDNADNKTVSWISSDPSVAKVDENGRVCAIREGTARITATANDGGKSASCTVSVYNLNVKSISVSPDSVTLNEGETTGITVSFNPINARDKRLIWSSSDTAIATVTGNGDTGIITGLKDGSAEITVTSADGRKTATCSVTVLTKDPIEAFVYRLYRICLRREPDPGGFSSWVSALRNHTANGANVAAGFYNSEEMTKRGPSNGEYVERAYLGFMGRGSDAAGKAYWVRLLDNGASYGRIIEGFSQSQEFSELCNQYGITRGTYTSTEARDKNDGVTAFTSRLYTEALGRNYDIRGLNAWCQTILNNLTRDTVLNVALNGFLHSEEFVSKNLPNDGYVDVMYRTFLGRMFDESGLAYWLGKLAEGMTRDWLAQQFANSQEFSAIMSAFGL